ncbi:unnamed protein product [Aspergillus oryzae RIB40]|uniref:DNA, SC009 n=2 Tax=Aspergillus oryzae TaxID=5062 RepID=Q2UUH1_ASPOR|nr:unnamed protein product [Aspergillus oryzae RIB40]EIT72506.1 hypothetical protein Ao3042_00980 [Aspergillus oryzae 3.042]KDE83976.1 hypothetical protein AO1008_10518 [Aspergillus oryzae 100-8]BAE54794.1 unnamed protein product [Aspergillus oryzae RIB40]|eukprot:EIT72506.1 hypothetical protein Ao3042_00980 [Aspergillus oryzae 3.042]
MAFNKKYAGLPDLDLAPDIYETPDLTDEASTVPSAPIPTQTMMLAPTPILTAKASMRMRRALTSSGLPLMRARSISPTVSLRNGKHIGARVADAEEMRMAWKK